MLDKDPENETLATLVEGLQLSRVCDGCGDKQHGRGGFFGNKAAFERSEAQAAAAGVGGLYLFAARLEVPLETCPGERLVAEAPLPARFEARREWEASGAAEVAATEDDVGV